MHKPVKYVEKAVTVAAKGAWVVFNSLNQDQAEPLANAKMVGEAAAEVLRKDQAAPGLAALH